jgi:hypothetical protein
MFVNNILEAFFEQLTEGQKGCTYFQAENAPKKKSALHTAFSKQIIVKRQ